VSPATIYIYYENKEDLLVSTFVEIKKMLSEALLINFDNQRPFRDILKTFWMMVLNFRKNIMIKSLYGSNYKFCGLTNL
jgi:AcrR family transcriptional regulator